jgi:hypothetical protein
METCIRVGIEADCEAHHVGIAGPDGTILGGAMSPTPAIRRARRTAGGEGAESRDTRETLEGKAQPRSQDPVPTVLLQRARYRLRHSLHHLSS